jgi:hypothetical protein
MHTYSCTLWTTFAILRRWLRSALLGGVLYYFLIHASWRAHLESFSRWTLSTFSYVKEYFIVFCMHASWRAHLDVDLLAS